MGNIHIQRQYRTSSCQCFSHFQQTTAHIQTTRYFHKLTADTFIAPLNPKVLRMIIKLCSLMCTGLFPWINITSLLSQMPVKERISSLLCIYISAFPYFPACYSITQVAVPTSGEII